MQAVEHLHDHDHHDHEHEHNHTRENIQAWAKTAILFGLAAYFIYVIVSGNLANYINARFAWLSYVAVVLFLLLGISSAWELLRKRGHEHHHDHEHHDHEHHDHDHNHGQVTWLALGIVAVPLVLGTLIPSRPLGSAAVGGSISLNAVSAAGAQPFTSDPLKWNVLDWLRVFNSSGDMNSFNGKQADVVGFVYREATFPDDQFMAARFTISCCVADAGAIGVPVQWDAAQDFPADTWVRVQGTWEVGEFRGDTVPILHPTIVEKIDQPEHPYLYP
jgi:putative membrane protein